MKKFKVGNAKQIGLFLVAITAITSSSVLWLQGLVYSPLFDRELHSEEKFIREFIDSNSLDYQQEKVLAESYWLRYRDIRKNNYWGINGPMGVWGPRDHFIQHGKREGRIFKPVHQPENLETEEQLAEIYWQNYPEIRSSPIWGEKSSLGILGPRDHFRYFGRLQGKIWGNINQQKTE